MLSTMANPRKSMLGKRNRVFNGPPTPPWLLPVPEKKTGLGKGSAKKGTLEEQFAELRRTHDEVFSSKKSKLVRFRTSEGITCKRKLFQSHLRNKENVGPTYQSNLFQPNNPAKSGASKPHFANNHLKTSTVQNVPESRMFLRSASRKRFTTGETSVIVNIKKHKVENSRINDIKCHIKDGTTEASSRAVYRSEDTSQFDSQNKEYDKSNIGHTQYIHRSNSQYLSSQETNDVKPKEKIMFHNGVKSTVKVNDGALPSRKSTTTIINKSQIPMFNVNSNRNLKYDGLKKNKSGHDRTFTTTTSQPDSVSNACGMNLVEAKGDFIAQQTIDKCMSVTEQKLWKGDNEPKDSSVVNNFVNSDIFSDRNNAVGRLKDVHVENITNDAVMTLHRNRLTRCLDYSTTATQTDCSDFVSSNSVALQSDLIKMDEFNPHEDLFDIKRALKKLKLDHEKVKLDNEKLKLDYEKLMFIVSDYESKLAEFGNNSGKHSQEDERISSQTPRCSLRIASMSNNAVSGCKTLLQTPNKTDSDDDSSTIGSISAKPFRSLGRKSLSKYKELKSNFNFLKTPQTGRISKKKKVPVITPKTTAAKMLSDKLQTQLHMLYD